MLDKEVISAQEVGGSAFEVGYRVRNLAHMRIVEIVEKTGQELASCTLAPPIRGNEAVKFHHLFQSGYWRDGRIADAQVLVAQYPGAAARGDQSIQVSLEIGRRSGPISQVEEGC
jgi:hypothetical protein